MFVTEGRRYQIHHTFTFLMRMSNSTYNKHNIVTSSLKYEARNGGER